MSEPDRVEPTWSEWFQTLNLKNPISLAVFFTILNNFVAENPDIASYLTVEDLQAILTDEI